MKVITPTSLALAFAFVSVTSGAGTASEPSLTKLRSALGSKTGIALKLIPSGSFLMGSPLTEARRKPDEGPQHKVTLSRDFFLAETAVTNEAWEKVMGRSAYDERFAQLGPNMPTDSKVMMNRVISVTERERAMHPSNAAVGQVSWGDAVEFCARLNQRFEKELPAGWQFVLPTEAQWEYACRAGTTGPFASEAEEKISEIRQGAPWLLAVDKYPPNNWGLYGMNGGVSEWVADWFADYTKEAQVDPTGEDTGVQRVVRGGYVRGGLSISRSAARKALPPETKGAGVRVALVYRD